MKRAILLLLSILTMIGACGCGMRETGKVKRMLSYVNEKYEDDRFEYVTRTGGYFGSNVTRAEVRSEKYPNQEIYVICSEVNGKECFSDTYLNMKFYEQTRAYLHDAFSGAFGDNLFLQYEPSHLAGMSGGSSETSLEEFLSAPDTVIIFSAAVVGRAENEAEALAAVKAALSDAVVSGYIYFFDTQESLREWAPDAIKNQEYVKKLYIAKETVDEYSEIEWVNGT